MSEEFAHDVVKPASRSFEEKSARRHLLIDLENRQPTAAEISAWVEPGEAVWVFHGPHQKKLLPKLQALGDWVTLIPITKTGSNALDFHLTFHLGYLAAKHERCRFVVLSGDRGFDPMIKYARLMGFDVVRKDNLIGAATPKKTATKAPANKKTAASVKRAAAAKKPKPSEKPIAAAKSVSKVPATDMVVPTEAIPKTPKKSPAKANAPAKKSAPAKKASPTKNPAPAKKAVPAQKVPADIMNRVIVNLRDHPHNRPGTVKALQQQIFNLSKRAAPSNKIGSIVAKLTKAGTIKVTGTRIEYCLPEKDAKLPTPGNATQ